MQHPHLAGSLYNMERLYEGPNTAVFLLCMYLSSLWHGYNSLPNVDLSKSLKVCGLTFASIERITFHFAIVNEGREWPVKPRW